VSARDETENGGARNSKARAMVVAVAAILGMVLGFWAAYLLLVWTGVCPREHLCATHLAHSALAFVVVPFAGMACAFLALRGIEKRARMRDASR
jgi:H+/Cl- antiporter ClcA